MSSEYWEDIISDYKERPVDYPMEYKDWIEPYSAELASAYEKGEIVNSSVTDEIIKKTEERLDVKLPPSYLEFLKYSNGLLLPDKFTNLLPLEKVDWFYTLNQEWVDIWTEYTDDNVSDEEYFVYGKEQDTCQMRSKYLKTALQISDSAEGDVLLLNPEVKYGDEWEAWWFGNALAGAIRFKSFKELLEYLLAPDEEIEELSEEEYAKMIEKDKDLLKNMETSLMGSIVSGMLDKGFSDKDMISEFEKELATVQEMEKETINRINANMEEKDKIQIEHDDIGFINKVKEMISKKS